MNCLLEKNEFILDSLTCLPSRWTFNNILSLEVERARQNGHKLAVIYLGLDRFKNINNSLGHSVGDKLLTIISSRLKEHSRGRDVVAHICSDEFAFLVPQINNHDDAASFCRRILKMTGTPFLCEGYEFAVSFSIGIAVYPDNGKRPQTLIENAYTAMSRSKSKGGNRFEFYDFEMNKNSFEKFAIESRLNKALKQNEFLLHYQPQIELQTGRLTGMEALVRWNCPGTGIIAPGKFIPAAEESGLIVPMSKWILRTACAQNRAFQDTGFQPITVAVNLSARQFYEEDLLQSITQTINETGLDPCFLELELTEGVVIKNIDEAVSILSNLKSIGVRISIDDFGTGFSSLSYLKHFPVDVLKIDRSFVMNIGADKKDEEIIKAIISLAHSLDFKVVAEGVETKEQLDFLNEYKSDFIQGFYFSPPVPADDFIELLESNQQMVYKKENSILPNTVSSNIYTERAVTLVPL